MTLYSQNRNDASLLNNNTRNNNVASLNNTHENMQLLRGPQLPVTVQKANREDINDKFCKFEINKACITPLKEEQISEAWSLDADAPESVTNEICNETTAQANTLHTIETTAQANTLHTQLTQV